MALPGFLSQSIVMQDLAAIMYKERSLQNHINLTDSSFARIHLSAGINII